MRRATYSKHTSRSLSVSSTFPCQCYQAIVFFFLSAHDGWMWPEGEMKRTAFHSFEFTEITFFLNYLQRLAFNFSSCLDLLVDFVNTVAAAPV